MDLKGGFDSINYKELWKKMYQHGISSKLIRKCARSMVKPEYT